MEEILINLLLSTPFLSTSQSMSIPHRYTSMYVCMYNGGGSTQDSFGFVKSAFPLESSYYYYWCNASCILHTYMYLCIHTWRLCSTFIPQPLIIVLRRYSAHFFSEEDKKDLVPKVHSIVNHIKNL